ncbi:MAG: hypothetical protein JWM88_537 [Verrucomicrobia bacterium]|nr:hypothetical protein [Verrucomicrobiota bacterium]
MNLTWQIIRKDFRRLKWPLLFWAVVSVAKLVFYAFVGGAFGAADQRLLGALQGPLLAVRALFDPLIAFFLVGWLVYQDPLVERDAFWITRPISGQRLFFAKLLGALLLLVILPVAVSVPEWLSVGAGPRDLAVAAMYSALPMVIAVAVGLAAAALTDGFPRYVLWTLAGFAFAGVMRLAVDQLFVVKPHAAGTEGGLGGTRWLLFVAGVVVIALPVAWHQSVTRRLARSLALLGVSLALLTLAVCAWPFDLITPLAPGQGPEKSGDSGIRLAVTGDARYLPRSRSVVIPMTAEGAPENTMTNLRGRAEWSWDGHVAWTRNGNSFTPPVVVLEKLTGASAAPADQPGFRPRFRVDLSPVLAERMQRDPASFHADVQIEILEGALRARLPLGERVGHTGAGTFSVSNLERKGNSLALALAVRSMAVDLARVNFTAPFLTFALVNPRDGRMVLSRPKDLWRSYSLLDMVGISNAHLFFDSPTDASWFDDAVLVVAEFRRDRTIQRTLDIAPFRLVIDSDPANQKR